MKTTDSNHATSPTHIAYQIRNTAKQSFWTRIGAAWVHADGEGFSIQLDCIPLNGRITLRVVSEE
jgi:hypothetical protein